MSPSKAKNVAVETGFHRQASEIGQPWLTLVGIGEEGVANLSASARAALAEAKTVFGGARHLALAGDLVKGRGHAWPSPFAKAIEAVLRERGRPTAILASGDPFHHGVGATLARHVDVSEFRAFPAPSAFSLAASRLGWALQDVECLSLHGLPVSRLHKVLFPGAKIIALTSGGESPREIAALLREAGYGLSRLHVLEALGGARERMTHLLASELGSEMFNPLNTVAIEALAEPGLSIRPLGPGLDEAFFDHDGQITKRDIRAVTLGALEAQPRQTLWDVGAGAGSVSIEWLRLHPSLKAIAIEADKARAARIAVNAERFGVAELEVIHGRAPKCLVGLERPDRVFVGGGGSDPAVLECAMEALLDGGRLVANAVTLEMRGALMGRQERHGGALVEIGIAHAVPLGGMRALRPALPVLQWRWRKT